MVLTTGDLSDEQREGWWEEILGSPVSCSRDAKYGSIPYCSWARRGPDPGRLPHTTSTSYSFSLHCSLVSACPSTDAALAKGKGQMSWGEDPRAPPSQSIPEEPLPPPQAFLFPIPLFCLSNSFQSCSLAQPYSLPFSVGILLQGQSSVLFSPPLHTPLGGCIRFQGFPCHLYTVISNPKNCTEFQTCFSNCLMKSTVY